QEAGRCCCGPKARCFAADALEIPSTLRTFSYNGLKKSDGGYAPPKPRTARRGRRSGGTLEPQLRTNDSERLRFGCSGSTRENLDIEIATFRLCGNLRIKTWTNTPSPDGSPIPPPQKTNDDEDESSKPLDCLLMEAPRKRLQSPVSY